MDSIIDQSVKMVEAEREQARETLRIDPGEIQKFVTSLFKYASVGQVISLRTFPDVLNDSRPIEIDTVEIGGQGLEPIVSVATRMAQFAATHTKRAVFCPPIAGFSRHDKADEASLSEGYAISVECDEYPTECRSLLETILGPATIIVASGGVWTDPYTGQKQDKLHLHWRLDGPASGDQLKLLKDARKLATQLGSADGSNVPVSHPIRWPGSWHRKAAPKLARIVQQTDNELNLSRAAAALTRASDTNQQTRKGSSVRPHVAMPSWSEVEKLAAHFAEGMDRSSQFQRCVNKAAQARMSVDELEAVFRRHPEGCASKYLRPDRLRQEILRSFEKAQQTTRLPAYNGDALAHVARDIRGEVFTLTQDDVARAFAEKHAGQLRYCWHTKAWFEWQQTHWQRDETDRALQFVRLLARDLSEDCQRAEIKEVRKRAFAYGVELFARTDSNLAVTSKSWDVDELLLGTPGGTVDLRSGEVLDARSEDGITKLTAVAPSEKADCPMWSDFLMQATQGDLAYIAFLKRWFGYCLTGDTREHALLFAYGPGGNGKSVAINTVAGILNDYACVAAADTFIASAGEKHPTELAKLRGARLVTASETEQGKAWAEARIKSLTGGDTISARFMHKDFFEYKPQFKLMVVGNHKPSLNNVDEALKRRFNIAPFVHVPAVKDPFLETKLRSEWPGILRWMIEGCLEWQSDGLKLPQAVTSSTDDYFATQDVFGQWLDEQCDVDVRRVSKWAPHSELYQSWFQFSRQAGEAPGSARSFSSRLSTLGFQRRKEGHLKTVGFAGITLRSKVGFTGGVFD